MDQTLALKLEEFQSALQTLEEAIAQPKNNLRAIRPLNALNTPLSWPGKPASGC